MARSGREIAWRDAKIDNLCIDLAQLKIAALQILPALANNCKLPVNLTKRYGTRLRVPMK